MEDKAIRKLIAAALEARKNSYSPYSGFSVGAALMTSDGSVFTGVNIESASYSMTVCAERTAIFKAVSEGRRDFTAIAIVGGREEVSDYCYPCGACRQVMTEFCDYEGFVVISAVSEEDYKLFRLRELIPTAFSFEK